MKTENKINNNHNCVLTLNIELYQTRETTSYIMHLAKSNINIFLFTTFCIKFVKIYFVQMLFI